MQIQERTLTNTGKGYRFGFNGKENEVDGGGNSYDFGARIYNSRLGRFYSVDPWYKGMPSTAPYCFADNSPVILVDFNGLGPKIAFILESHPGEHQFDDHVKSFKEKGYTVVYVKTGQEILDKMEELSSPENPIESMVIVSHGYTGDNGGGLVGEGGNDNGFYTDQQLYYYAKLKVETEKYNEAFDAIIANGGDIETATEEAELIVKNYIGSSFFLEDVANQEQAMRDNGAATVNDLVGKIDAGSISYKPKTAMVLGGCNVATNSIENSGPSLASELARKLYSNVVASADYTAPVHGTSKRTGKWYLFKPSSKPKYQGRTFDMALAPAAESQKKPSKHNEERFQIHKKKEDENSRSGQIE